MSRQDSIVYYAKASDLTIRPDDMAASALTLQFLARDFMKLNEWILPLEAKTDSHTGEDVPRELNKLRLLNVSKKGDFAMRVEYMIQTMMLTAPQKDPALAYWLATNACEVVDDRTWEPLGIIFLDTKIVLRLKNAGDYYLCNIGEEEDCIYTLTAD